MLCPLSPHLEIVLKRHFRPEQLSDFKVILDFVAKNGGVKELHFERKEGVSFNPRFARVALILMQDAKCLDLNVLGAAVLACAESSNSDFDPVIESVADETRDKFLTPLEFVNSDSILIGAALALDYARHLHLSRINCEDEKIKICNAIVHYLELFKDDNNVLLTKLLAWKERKLIFKQHGTGKRCAI
jgi:hypothetical protein